MPDVKIYGYATSPYVRKVGAFLYYKDIPFTHVPVNPVDPAATIGHTNGTMVPVLEIDGEHRRESSELAFWLDEVFPGKPLCPAENADTIKEADRWVSDTFLRSIFRPAIDAPLTLNFRYRFWRLAALVSAHTPLPEQIRHLWPDFVKAAPFIKSMGEDMDLTESISDMQVRIAMELVDLIGDGPFLCGLPEPSMLDLAVFPNLIFGYMFGLEEHLSAAMQPSLKAWMIRVAEHLPANPTLVADEMQVNALKDGLG
ncbi:MAG: glutathione S-transferase family protein [Pseudomonadota bacterium]